MFWIALGDVSRISLMRFLQHLWDSESAKDKAMGLPDELFHWKSSSSVVDRLLFADVPSTGSEGSVQLSSTDSQPILISEGCVIYLPRYSSMNIMRSKLIHCIDNL